MSLDGGLIETILSNLPAASLARAGQVDRICYHAQTQAAIEAAARMGWPLIRREQEPAAHALHGVEMMAAHSCSIAAGAAHTLCVRSGTLYACGGHPHYYGPVAHLGVGHVFGDYVRLPTAVTMPATSPGVPLDVRCLAAGGAHSALLTASGELYTWGAKGGGRLGLGPLTSNQPVPCLVRLPTFAQERVVQVACGSRHTLFLTQSGQAFGCGANDLGQLGTGGSLSEVAEARVPVAVLPPSSAATAVAAADHAIDGEGPLGRSSSTSAAAPEGPAHRAAGAAAWAAVCACEDHSAAISTARDLYGWGSNRHGQLGVPTGGGGAMRSPTRVESPAVSWASVSAGPCSTAAVSTTGEAFIAFVPSDVCGPSSWGFRRVPLPAGMTVRQVAAGEGYLALLGLTAEMDGEVWLCATGGNRLVRLSLGACPVDGVAERALELAMGYGHLVVKAASGAVLVHGQDCIEGQLGLGDMLDTTVTTEGDHVDFGMSMARWADEGRS